MVTLAATPMWCGAPGRCSWHVRLTAGHRDGGARPWYVLIPGQGFLTTHARCRVPLGGNSGWLSGLVGEARLEANTTVQRGPFLWVPGLATGRQQQLRHDFFSIHISCLCLRLDEKPRFQSPQYCHRACEACCTHGPLCTRGRL